MPLPANPAHLADAELARMRKELANSHSADVSRVEQEFEAARSAMRAEVAALESALAGERAHSQELEKVRRRKRTQAHASARARSDQGIVGQTLRLPLLP